MEEQARRKKQQLEDEAEEDRRWASQAESQTRDSPPMGPDDDNAGAAPAPGASAEARVGRSTRKSQVSQSVSCQRCA